MRFHALQSMYEDALPLEIHRSSRCQYLPLNIASRPELVYHSSPRVLRIRAEVRCPILADHRPGCRLRERQVDDVFLVCIRLDCMALPIFTHGNRGSIGCESVLVIWELDVREVLRTPDVRLRRIVGEDLRCHLCRCPYAAVLLSELSRASGRPIRTAHYCK